MKDVLISGAFGGMGRAALNKLVKEGYRVFALDKKVEDAGENVIPIEADVTSEESLFSALNKVKEYTSELFAIVHLAGIYYLDSLVEISEDRFIKIFDINLFGVYRINKIFLPLLKEGSRIIITTSELAPLSPLPFTGIYAISKTALDRYAYSLRMEVQLLGVFVSVIVPGAVKTDMLGASNRELDKFCETTELYECNAERFKKIVNGVEAKNVSPDKVAEKVYKAIKAKKPKFEYKLNRNPLLLLLNALPKRWQTKIIKRILKK